MAGGEVARPTDLIEDSGVAGEPKDFQRLTAAEQWQLIIPQMGYMALLRNLRNFDKAEIPDSLANKIAQRIADPAQVARSRQLPFRFYSAYINAPSLRWGHALEQALGHCLPNVPELPGRTLVLIDTSASMNGPLSERPRPQRPTGKGRRGGSPEQEPTRPRRMQAAALFGLALALKNPDTADVWGFADGQFRVTGVQRGASLLRAVEAFTRCSGNVGHGTQIEQAVRMTYGGHDRVCIFTDMQTFPTGRAYGYYGAYGVGDVSAAVPPYVPVYGFNLAGYEASAMPVAGNNRHELGGLTDATFALIPVIEASASARWPWENKEEAA